MSNMIDKITGTFLGTAIGDALGMPVETFDRDKIKKLHGYVNSYVSAKDHKWFNNNPIGSWTDDTQLTLAVAEGLMKDPKKINVGKIAHQHIQTYEKNGDSGWGKNTRKAVQNLKKGRHWSTSGRDECGLGNGTAMKVAPIGAFLATTKNTLKELGAIARVAQMTHDTNLGISAALAQSHAVRYCLETDPNDFCPLKFTGTVIKYSGVGLGFKTKNKSEDLTNMLIQMQILLEDDIDPVQVFKGHCHAAYSLPFTYWFFIKNPQSIDSLYEVINAGGDTDTNGSMLGACLGALHGTKIFPNHLVNELCGVKTILNYAEKFCEIFVK